MRACWFRAWGVVELLSGRLRWQHCCHGVLLFEPCTATLLTASSVWKLGMLILRQAASLVVVGSVSTRPQGFCDSLK